MPGSSEQIFWEYVFLIEKELILCVVSFLQKERFAQTKSYGGYVSLMKQVRSDNDASEVDILGQFGTN